jgi:hypothetical protein
MRQALAELGAVLPSEDAGPEDLVNYWALRLAAGSVDTVDGVNWILRQAGALDWPDWLNRLYGLASEWDDWPEGRAQVEAAMLSEVLALLASRRSDESPQRQHRGAWLGSHDREPLDELVRTRRDLSDLRRGHEQRDLNQPGRLRRVFGNLRIRR